MMPWNGPLERLSGRKVKRRAERERLKSSPALAFHWNDPWNGPHVSHWNVPPHPWGWNGGTGESQRLFKAGHLYGIGALGAAAPPLSRSTTWITPQSSLATTNTGS